MEARIELDEKRSFTPFTFAIRVESFDELLSLYQRFSSDSLKENYGARDEKRGLGRANYYNIWNMLQERVRLEERIIRIAKNEE